MREKEASLIMLRFRAAGKMSLPLTDEEGQAWGEGIPYEELSFARLILVCLAMEMSARQLDKCVWGAGGRSG